MTRAELEALSRDELIAQAKTTNVVRPEVLTRVELIDELLRRSEGEPRARARTRGFLGRARDLIATVIERGLHLPDAAARVRDVVPSWPEPPAPLATVTLAEIYAAQGHIDRALAVLDEVLAAEPEHASAAALADKLRNERVAKRAGTQLRAEDAWSDFATPLPPPRPIVSATTSPEVAIAAPEVEPALPPGPGHQPMLDDSPLPRRYDVDEAVVMPVDPTTAYVYWEIRAQTIASTLAERGTGRWVVRLFASYSEGDVLRTVVREVVSDDLVGDYFVFGLPEGAELHVTIGWASAAGFEPLVVGPTSIAPPGVAASRVADTLVRWTPELSSLVAPPLPPAMALAIAVEQATTPIEEPRASVSPPSARSLVRGNEAPPPQIVHVAPGVTKRVTWHRLRGALGSSEQWTPMLHDDESGPGGGVGSPGSSWMR